MNLLAHRVHVRSLLRDTGRLSALFFLLMLLTMALAMLIGEPISLQDALSNSNSLAHLILFEVRLPRVLLGMFAGGSLAITGTAFQALMRNPLAEPYVLGVAGGAALGATCMIAIGAQVLSFSGLWATGATSIAAGIGGFVSSLFVFVVAKRQSKVGSNATTLLLAGVMVNAIASSLITLIKALSSANTLQQVLFWLVGFLDAPTPTALTLLALSVVLGVALLLMDAAKLNILLLGDEQAHALGINVKFVELRVFLATSIMVGAVVAICGVIGFVGVVVPHALRMLFGGDNRKLLPLSFFGGATFLVFCDALSRLGSRFFHTEAPVGSITALIGAPLFLLLLLRGRSSE